MKKRILSLLIVCFMCLESFGAVVADNDGTSFLTKGEFDALKNDFAKQIQTYNESIDGKIDGAIAAYLSGTILPSTADSVCNINVLSFPLTVIDHLDCINSIYPSAVQTKPIIAIDYDIFSRETNRSTGLFDYFIYTEPSINKYWLSGDWASGKFVVNGNCSEPRLGVTGMIIVDSYLNSSGTADVGHAGLAMDYYNDGQTGVDASWEPDCTSKDRNIGTSGGGVSITSKTKKLLTDGQVFGKISSADFSTLGIIQLAPVRTDNASPFKWNASEDMDKFSSTASKRVFVDRISSFDTNKYLSWTFKSSFDDKIPYVYNVDDTQVTTTSKQKLYVAPSLYNNGTEIYLTNRKNNRIAIQNTDKSRVKAVKENVDVGANKNAKGEVMKTCGFEGVITAGLNIESKYDAISAHTYDKNYSAISTSDLIYNFTSSDGKNYTHDMTKGIPILSIPDGIKGGLVNISAAIDISSEKSTTTTNQKYICFSTEPITETLYDGSTISKNKIKAMNLLKIKSGGDGAEAGTDDKLFKLKDGENVFNISDTALTNIRTGDILYAKIYFSDSEQFVTINTAPKFTLAINR